MQRTSRSRSPSAFFIRANWLPARNAREHAITWKRREVIRGKLPRFTRCRQMTELSLTRWQSYRSRRWKYPEFFIGLLPASAYFPIVSTWNAVTKDLGVLTTTSQDWRPVDYRYCGPFIRTSPDAWLFDCLDLCHMATGIRWSSCTGARPLGGVPRLPTIGHIPWQ
jgi:hypothetical protein